jgi:U3 small nucleolar RNA-associated protein 14
MQKISKIIPEFSRVAQVGDEVMMGLEGDPKYPFHNRDRPMATISHITKGDDGIAIELTKNDGTTMLVNEYTQSPSQVWEFSDETFKNVLDREREKQNRAEQSLYRGNDRTGSSEISMLRQEVEFLKSSLEDEKTVNRDFHNTYIASLYELSGDICKLDTTGKCANFCRTFNAEYDKMKARAENGLYRGTSNGAVNYRNEKDDDSEEEEDEEDDESLSDVEFSAKDDMGQSDYF